MINVQYVEKKLNIQQFGEYNTSKKMQEEGKITEDDMQISEIRKLISVYKEQINVLDKEIAIKKANI